jgi:hypothetical protein
MIGSRAPAEWSRYSQSQNRPQGRCRARAQFAFLSAVERSGTPCCWRTFRLGEKSLKSVASLSPTTDRLRRGRRVGSYCTFLGPEAVARSCRSQCTEVTTSPLRHRTMDTCAGLWIGPYPYTRPRAATDAQSLPTLQASRPSVYAENRAGPRADRIRGGPRGGGPPYETSPRQVPHYFSSLKRVPYITPRPES